MTTWRLIRAEVLEFHLPENHYIEGEWSDSEIEEAAEKIEQANNGAAIDRMEIIKQFLPQPLRDVL